MSEIRYLISDASKKVDVETHVLRYWEEELGLSIPRNEMGHRYYTEFHIRLFCQIKKLKDRGYQLKAIKNALQQVMGQNQGFMQAAGILEEDMARTLQENQPLVFIKDKEGRFENITRLADYNRLEPANEEQFIQEKQGIKGNKGNNGQAFKENNKEKMQNKPEIMEKDGQTEMKKKGKNRKKPSAWERRNGITGNEQDINRKSDKENFYAEAFQKMKSENNVQDKTIQQTYIQEETMQQKQTHEEIAQQKHMHEELIQQKHEELAQQKQMHEGLTQQEYTPEELARQNYVQERPIMKINLPEKNTTKEKEVFLKTEKDLDANRQLGEDTNLKFHRSLETNRPLETDTPLETNTSLETDTPLETNMSLETNTPSETNTQVDTNIHLESNTTELTRASAEPTSAFLLTEQEEKMQQFQNIMNHIIGHALEANNEKLSQEISNLVNERLSEELEDLMRIRDERDEERFRQFDEIIRSYQRESQGKAEAAAAKIPFFKRGRFKKNRHPQNA